MTQIDPRARRQAKRIGRELREEFRAAGEFNQAEFESQLFRRLDGFRGDAYGGFVTLIAREIDEESTQEASEEQPTLFDMGGEFRLGGGRRIAKRLARVEHADEWLAIDEQNLAAVAAASARKHEQIARLRPYWGPGVTMEEAVAAYSATRLAEAGH